MLSILMFKYSKSPFTPNYLKFMQYIKADAFSYANEVIRKVSVCRFFGQLE